MAWKRVVVVVMAVWVGLGVSALLGHRQRGSSSPGHPEVSGPSEAGDVPSVREPIHAHPEVGSQEGGNGAAGLLAVEAALPLHLEGERGGGAVPVRREGEADDVGRGAVENGNGVAVLHGCLGWVGPEQRAPAM